MSLSQSISFRFRVAYASPALALALMGITFYVFLPKFYVDTVGISAQAFGIIILVSRLWDAVLDPVLGYLSDRTRHSMGRRRPWILYGAVPLILVFVALCNPLLVAPYWQLPWAAGCTILFFFFWTLVSVPYQSLGAELSFDYDERTKLLAFRDGALVAGTVLAVVIPEIVGRLINLPVGPALEAQRFSWLGITYALLVVGSVTWCVSAVRERKWGESVRPTGSVANNVTELFKNRPFVILLLSYTIGGFGAQLPATLFLFYVQYVLHSTQGPQFLLLYFAVGFVCLPAWVWIASRWEKKQTWLTAMSVNVGAFLGVLFLGPGDEALYCLLVALSGVGYGATLALPSSMQGDVIDFDELESGKRREGQFTGFWLISSKLAGALGAGIALPVLDFTGYIPNAAQQPESTIAALRWMYAGVPCICYGIAIVVASRYPITRELHQKIRHEIEVRGH